MTPREKAIELAEKFAVMEFTEIRGWYANKEESKKTAALVVDEILNISYFDESTMSEDDSLYKNYWLQVKEEIKNL